MIIWLFVCPIVFPISSSHKRFGTKNTIIDVTILNAFILFYSLKKLFFWWDIALFYIAFRFLCLGIMVYQKYSSLTWISGIKNKNKTYLYLFFMCRKVQVFSFFAIHMYKET